MQQIKDYIGQIVTVIKKENEKVIMVTKGKLCFFNFQSQVIHLNNFVTQNKVSEETISGKFIIINKENWSDLIIK